MKRIGKVPAIAILLLAYIAIVCFGVLLVIDEEKVGALTGISDSVLGTSVCSQREQMQKQVDDTLEWIAEETAQERAISDYIDTKLTTMTMEQKLAQMMILTNEHDITAFNMQTYQPGGVIFFEVDFRGKTMETVRNRVDMLQSYMQVPLFVGVDEEGGEVSRLKTLAEGDMPDFEGARTLAEKGEEAVTEDTVRKMQYLREMGLNLNFAPVADIVDSTGSYMYRRSAGGDAETVSDYVETVLAVMQENQVVGCIKHFPGYGDNVNTHDGLAHDSKSLEEYENKDFLPFQAGIAAGVDMVMVSHIVMEAVDEENPASMSLQVHNILREELGFDGVVMADDLNMQAILQTMTIEEATAKAFVAGNDMIFSANFAASMKGAMNAVNEGTLTEEQVNASVSRILRMKIDNGLIVLE